MGREALMEKIHDDKPSLQSWPATALPDIIISLCRHPTATGANDYYPDMPKPERE